jgi:predicted GIY-YIG superfamily endonuclease
MAYTYTYIVECRSKAGTITYYVGGTNNPRQRITAHLAGKGAKYLKGREILRIIITHVYSEAFLKKYDHEDRFNVVDLTFNPPPTANMNDWPFVKFWHRCDKCTTFIHKEYCEYCEGTGGVFD